MKYLFLFFILFFCFISSFAQYGPALRRDDEIKRYINSPSKKNYLLVKSKFGHFKRRIKQGATLKLTLLNTKETGLCELLLVNDTGLFVSPYILQADSIVTDTNGYEKTFILPVKQNKVEFIFLDSIQKIGFTNHLKRKSRWSLLLATLGAEMLLLPPFYSVLSGAGPLDYLGEPPGVFLLGLGMACTFTGAIRFKKLQHLKTYSLGNYEFNIKSNER